MGKLEKLETFFQTDPIPNNIDFDDVKRYLELHGIMLVRTKGSHNLFSGRSKSGRQLTICVPTVNGRKVKPYIVKQMREIIIEMEK